MRLTFAALSGACMMAAVLHAWVSLAMYESMQPSNVALYATGFLRVEVYGVPFTWPAAPIAGATLGCLAVLFGLAAMRSARAKPQLKAQRPHAFTQRDE